MTSLKWVFPFFVFAIASCEPGKPSVYPVKGSVHDGKGKPAVGAMVMLHPAKPFDDATKPVATVDDKGDFTLTTYVAADGAPAGDYTITVTWVPPRKTPLDPERPDQLQGRYADPAKSALKFAVKSGDNAVPPIVVK